MQYDELTQEQRSALDVLAANTDKIKFFNSGNIICLDVESTDLRDAMQVFCPGWNLICEFRGIESLVREASDRMHLPAGFSGNS